MKAEAILLSDIEDYLKFVELQRDLVAHLTLYTELQEGQLKRLEKIRRISESLVGLKKAKGFRIGESSDRDEIIKAIKKHYAQRGY